MSNSLFERGDTGPGVTELQRQLLSMGFAIGSADGFFGSLTEEAVVGFQLVVGLDPDGIAGPLTRGALESGAWYAIGDLHTAVRRFTAEETTETHKITTVFQLDANWQHLAHDQFATPHTNLLISRAMSELIGRVRRTAYGTEIDGLTFEANNCFDLAGPSLASMTLLVSGLPTPWAWAETFRMDLVADKLLWPADLFMPTVDYPHAMYPIVAAQMGEGDPSRYEPEDHNYRNVAIRPDGLRVYFDPGSALAGETGLATADIPFSAIVGLIRPSIVARSIPGTTHTAPAGPLLT